METKPTKITLEIISGSFNLGSQSFDKQIRLRVDIASCRNGMTVIEAVPVVTDQPKIETVTQMRKNAQKYAKRWSIPFVDAVPA